MNTIILSRRVVKGGSNGTGWITIPTNSRERLKLNFWYEVHITNENEYKTTLNFLLCLKKLKSSWGFYIPKKICETTHLIGKIVTISISPSEFFQSKISAYKQIRLPKSLVELREINHADMYEVEVKIGPERYKEVVLIKVIERTNRTSADEYYFTIRLADIPKAKKVKVKLLRKIEQLTVDKKRTTEKKIYLPNLFSEAIIGKIDDKSIIIFLGNHLPIISPITINNLEVLHYFGCYYSDGTKSGYGWSINASTPEQARYYIEVYKKIVLNKKLSFELTYSKKPSNKESLYVLTNRISNYWKERAHIQLKQDQIKIKKAKSDKTQKWNPYGSLRIRDFRSIVLELHLRLLNRILDYLQRLAKIQQLWLFLFGVLEGDGYVSGGKKRFGIGFATTVDDSIIRNSLNKLKIIYSTDDSEAKKGQGKVLQIRIGLKEVLSNLPTISENIFRLYPKRRILFIKKLLNKPSTKRLMASKDLSVKSNAEKKLVLCLLELKRELETQYSK